MLNLLQKLRMISGGKVVAFLSACALAAPVANPAAAYDQFCFSQHGGYATNGVYLRKVGETDPEKVVWSHRMKPTIWIRQRKCMDVRGRMSPGEPFNIVQDVKSGSDKRCFSVYGQRRGQGHGTSRWPAGGGTLEMEGHGSLFSAVCVIVNPRMWDGCADDSLGGFGQLGCRDWQPELHQHAAYDNTYNGYGVAYLRSVLERGADPNVGRRGETPLHAALHHWRKDHMDALLAAGADPMLKDRKGDTALRALLKNHGRRHDALYMFKRMLWARGSPDAGRSARLINEGLAANGVPAMINVVLSGNPDLVEFALEQGGDAHATTYSRYSALHHAAKRSLRMVRLLLEKEADPNVSTRGGFGTPLHWTVNPRFANGPLMDGDRGEMARAMLQAGGDPNMADRNGKTPLHFAAEIGNDRIVDAMLRHGGDPNHADNNGLTALHHAAVAGHSQIMERLLRRGADPSLEDRGGNTAEELANR